MHHFKIDSSIIHEQFGDETVVVNLDTGCYYSLRGTADTIWALAASGLSGPDIVARMASAFPAMAAEAEQETSSFLETLVAEGLFTRQNEASASSEPPAIIEGVFIKPLLQRYTDMETLLKLDPIHSVDDVGWPSAKPTANK